MAKTAIKTKHENIASPAVPDEVKESPVARQRAKQRPQPILRNMLPAEHGRQEWEVLAEPEHNINDVMMPGYLWQINERITPGAEVRIRHPLHKFVVVLYVYRIDRELQAIMSYPLNVFDFKDARPMEMDFDDIEIVHKGALGYCVVRAHHVLRSGFHTEAEATKWLDEKKQGK